MTRYKGLKKSVQRVQTHLEFSKVAMVTSCVTKMIKDWAVFFFNTVIVTSSGKEYL